MCGGIGKALVGGDARPSVRLLKILRNTFSAVEHECDAKLRSAVTLLSSVVVPGKGFRVIWDYALAEVMHLPDKELRFRRADLSKG